jgi:hypothetical protein
MKYLNKTNNGFYLTSEQKEELLNKINNGSHAECQEIAKELLIGINICGDRVYDSEFGDEKKCSCGHSYYRHFDSHDGMRPIGCKYCSCMTFEE